MLAFPRIDLIQGGDSPDEPVLLVIDPIWRKSVERACLLKDALDHAIRWPEKCYGIPSIESTLLKVGFVSADFAHGGHKLGPQQPDMFVKLLMGQWFSRQDKKGEAIGCVRVPAWSVMGWVRKDSYAETPTLPLDEIKQLAKDVPSGATKSDPAPSLNCIGGIPLFFAGEGKNRAQLFRLAERPYDSVCTWYSAPDVKKFVAARLVMTKNIVVLRGIDEDGRRFADILPFGKLSTELLAAAGVSRQARPSLSGWLALWRTLWRKFDESNKWLVFKKVVKTMVADEKTKRLRLIGGFDFASGK